MRGRGEGGGMNGGRHKGDEQERRGRVEEGEGGSNGR